MSRIRSSRNVISSEGRCLGPRCVMYCRETRLYVKADCAGETPSRMWAWSGTPAQSMRARDAFGIGEEFVLYRDGREKIDE